MSMGKNVADFRKRKGFMQEELGQKLGVTNQAVSKLESDTSLIRDYAFLEEKR